MSYYNNPFESGEFMKTAGYGKVVAGTAGAGMLGMGALLTALGYGPGLLKKAITAPFQAGAKAINTLGKPGGGAGMIQGFKDATKYGGPAAAITGGILLHQALSKPAAAPVKTLFGNLNPMQQGALLSLGGLGAGALGMGLYNKYKQNDNSQYSYNYQYYPKYGSWTKTAGSPGFNEGRSFARGLGAKAIALSLVPAAVAAGLNPGEVMRGVKNYGTKAYESIRKSIDPSWISPAEMKATLADKATSLVGKMSDWEKALTVGTIGLGSAGIGALAYDNYRKSREGY